MAEAEQSILRSVRPLRMIFFGTLLLVIDVYVSWTVNRQGIRIDFLNDTAAWVLLAFAACSLARFAVDGTFGARMAVVKIVAIIALIDSTFEFFIIPLPWPIELARHLVSLAAVVAAVLFCTAMRQLSAARALVRSEPRWRVTGALFLLLYLIPDAVAFAVIWISWFSVDEGRRVRIQAEGMGVLIGVAAIIVLIALALVPLVWFLISTHGMAREALEVARLEVRARAAEAGSI